MLWLNVLKQLLPNARAWRITVDKRLRQFFEGLAELPADARTFLDSIFDDIDPFKTRQLGEWEQQFGLPATGMTEADRRSRLDATWKALGGQDPRYIEDTLQAAGFDVYVHEWWVPISGRPGGGSIDGDEIPVARNPNTYLDDGNGGLSSLMFDGGADSQDGDALAMDGSTATPTGYPLVNKVLIAFADFVSDGSPLMQDGGALAQDGGAQDPSAPLVFVRKPYPIPDDSAAWPFFLYIGGQTFPESASVLQSRRDEFEDLCLKICPTEQWLGILATYS